MHIDIITVLPELLESPFSHSIMKRARDKGLLQVEVHHLRQWAVNEYGQVDVNDETSALMDSFQDNLLAPPVYTRPADFRGWKVPDILLSGDPKKVEDWRYEQSLQRTKERRPDLL